MSIPREVPVGAREDRAAPTEPPVLVVDDDPAGAAAAMQARARLPRLHVLVHTRHTKPRDVGWALDAGGDAVVPKPARPGILLCEVHRLEGAARAVA